MSELEKIGRFTVLERLGVGSFTVVYRGEDTFSKLPVAIKICIAQDENLRTGFLRLAETAGRLRHPNIVSVLEFGSGEGKPYLVEEYIPGEHLGWRIEGDEPISEARRTDFLRQIAEAMAYAHGQGVLHKHLGPRSIRVVDATQVKVADFGVAQLANATARLADPQTTTRTDGYLAPEQALGLRADARTDIFCFGALAFELLTYEKPFAGDSLAEFLEQTLQGPAGAAADRLRNLPSTIAPIIRRSLMRDPSDRYESFGELLDAFGVVAGFVPRAAVLDRSSPSLDDTQQIPNSVATANEEESLAESKADSEAPEAAQTDAEAPSSWLTASLPSSTLKEPGDDPGDVTLLPKLEASPSMAEPLEATNVVPWTPDQKPEAPGTSPRPETQAETEPGQPPAPVPKPPRQKLPEPPQPAAIEMAGEASLEETPEGAASDSASEEVAPARQPQSPSRASDEINPPRPGLPPLRPSRKETTKKPTEAQSQPSRRSSGWKIAAAGALLAVLGFWALSGKDKTEEPAPSPVLPPPPSEPVETPVLRPGFVSVDARPWAEISIVRPDGSILEIEEPFTPQLLSLEPGPYSIQLLHPDAQEPQTCQIQVQSGETELCVASFPTLAPTDYFKRTGWWR